MAHSPERKFRCKGVLRFAFAFVCVCLVGYVVGPTLFIGLKNKSTARASCPPCFCDCSSKTDSVSPPDCGKHSPDVKALKKDIVDLLSEEIALQKIVSNETLERTKAQRKYTKRASSYYRKMAEKCYVGVETCEEGRQRVEAELEEELKLTALWKKRARELGWKDSKRLHNTS
ncbi:PREDICTED: uncharacterized protein LOC18611982 [Theobroma cacao]|uniref:Uncharacterized protein LOC18611982 n=1 Tax=Theobroma cacao TaxID=3641 RepID=A0AB32VPD2_THECC|nr:PREDICTED: uncharacterized protein LOC18611982 [Theobroma cacao]